MLNDADYIVPRSQCCKKIDFGRFTYRWCHFVKCYYTKKTCFKTCQNKHQPATPPSSSEGANRDGVTWGPKGPWPLLAQKKIKNKNARIAIKS